MAIAALVLHLDPVASLAVRAHLAADEAITVGEAQVLTNGVLLPVVAASIDAAEGEARFEALRAMPGVRFVDVVMVDFSDEDDEDQDADADEGAL